MKLLNSMIFILLIIPIVSHGRSINSIPDDHPRVYINQEDLDVLKKKVNVEKFRETWQYIKKYDHPFASTFEALVTQNEEMAAKAAIDFLPMLKACTDARQPLNEMHLGACIYDWAYDQMSDSLQQAYITELKRIASLSTDLQLSPRWATNAQW